MYQNLKNTEIILAATPAGEIGYMGGVPWRLEGDLARFRSLTMGQVLIMGRTTFEGLPRPLKGREIIVVSNTVRENAYADTGALVARSLDHALMVADGLEGERVFVAGGARLYEEALMRPCTVHLTTVYKTSPEGYDTKIRNFDLRDFEPLSDPKPVFEKNESTGVMVISHTYGTYRRGHTVSRKR